MVSQGSAGSIWDVVGNATYAEAGNYTPAVSVVDAGGNTVQTSDTSFQVADAALTDTTPAANVINAFTGGTGPFVMATFTDGNPFAQPSDFPTVDGVKAGSAR